MEINDNPFVLRDAKAVRLVKLRANDERRSAANSAAVTIIESLSSRYGPQLRKDTNDGADGQGKS